MNIKRYIVAALALFVFIFLYEWLLNGVLLSPIYNETPSTWRTLDEMKTNFPLLVGFHFLFSAWVAFIFTQFYPQGGLKNGLLFGLFIGVLVGILGASWYLWIPVSAKLALGWFFGGLVEGIGGGLVLGSLYHRR